MQRVRVKRLRKTAKSRANDRPNDTPRALESLPLQGLPPLFSVLGILSLRLRASLKTRVANMQTQRGQRHYTSANQQNYKKARAQLALHLRAFQAVKDRFISEQGTSVSVAEFVNAVYTSDQDENNRRGQEAQKQAEGRAHQCGPDGFAVEEDEVVDRSSNEDEERENLKGESAQGNVDTRLVGPCRVG